MNIDQKIEALLNSTSLNTTSSSGSAATSQKGKIKIWGITATASLLLSCILVYVIKPVYVLNLDYSTVEKKVHQNINWKRWFTAVFAISLLIAYPVYSFVLLKF
jgi:hypothetical protein